ncbi:MAG: hypothetical protein F6K11_30650 [Leptolyngbya sp. SIO3F4]|nr:hypothetical protein [Leptolyngbya sp. SIO3F4]
MLDSFLNLLQQFDTSMLGDLSELDWANIATYGTLILVFAGIVWTAAKTLVQFLWQKTEGIIGFITSTLVVVSLWYTLIRVHVSISFNLDKEVFDNLLWFSAILFTPYYLIHYNLLTGFLLTLVRTLELLLDLFVLSWFPGKAEQNREKWRNRLSSTYAGWIDNVQDFFQQGRSAVKKFQMSFGLTSSEDVETTSEEASEDENVSSTDDGEAKEQDVTEMAN